MQRNINSFHITSSTRVQFKSQIDILFFMLKLQPTKKSSFKTRLCHSGVLFCLLFSSFSSADNAKLLGVEKEITLQQLQLNNHEKNLNTLQDALKKQEQSINTYAKKIRTAKVHLSALTAEISTLNVESLRLKDIQKNQMLLLKKLLDSHYRHGKHTQLSTVFSNETTSNIDRMTLYTERLSKARTDSINKLEETNETLVKKRQLLELQTKKQNDVLLQLQIDKKKLEIGQKRKQKTVRAIQHQVSGNKSNLTELKHNEKRLKLELEIAKKKQKEEQKRREKQLKEKQYNETLQAHVKMDGLGKYKTRLQWPVRGKILHRYGTQQSGEVNWNGIVISAKEGEEVKATHDGTIVLSNWLRGYGLMLVIDHGKGDMSFYGYNQALLRNVGDTVKAGDPIALVGNSGGQSSSGLYFEIRRKGNATNPSPWLK